MKKVIIVFLCVVSLLGIIPNINDTKVNADVQASNTNVNNKFLKQFSEKIDQNGGLQKIDNLVLKEIIHEFFPLGEEKESQILGELNHQRMSGKNPVVILGLTVLEWLSVASVLFSGYTVARNIYVDLWKNGQDLSHYKWVPTTKGQWLYCNGYKTCKNGWQWLYSSSVKHNRWFNFKNNVLEVGYKWVKYGTHWMFLDDDRGYETNEWGYVISGNNNSVRKNYHFDNNGYCTNP